MKGVDSHCHLDFKQFNEDRDIIIERSKERLDFIVNPGANPEHNRRAFKLHEKHPEFIKFNIGLHPVYTDDFNNLDIVKKQIKELDPCAIGEIGLDHHHVNDSDLRKKQEDVFREMLVIAEKLNKPVVIHSRDAEAKTVSIINEYDIDKVFLHCFNGSIETAKKAVSFDWKIGITTQVLYSSHVQNMAKELNLENILLETDSPYLYRGDRNEPLNVLESAEKIAEIKDVSNTTVLKKTSKNSHNLYLD